MLEWKMAILQTILCGLDRWVDVGYISMTLACGVTALFPALLDALASHGKTRRQRPLITQQKQQLQQQHGSWWWWWWLSRRLWTATVPKQWFGHFYICGLVVLTVTLGLAQRLQQQQQQHQPPASFCSGSIRIPSNITLLLLYLHFSRRFYECRCVHQWQSTSVMHWSGYVVGILHYVGLPFVFVRFPSSADVVVYPKEEEHGGHSWFFFSTLLCLWAQYQQHRHHILLADLRNVKPKQEDDDNHNNSTSPHGNNYRLPTGGWFPYIVCPHYLAEILIYLALALLLEHESGPDHRRPWIVLVWVVTNLTVSARIHLQWYRNHLPPEAVTGRTAILPFVW